jgi:hypothetical protein
LAADPSVTDFQHVSDWLKSLAGNWTQYTVVGSFFLYVLGYLVLRFHLTAMGLGTDLTIVDERYLFAGARFLVYLAATVPVSLVIAYAVWRLWRLLPPRVGRTFVTPAFAIVFSLLTIQLVMRQCFLLGNLLLADDLSRVPPWLASLLVDDTYMLLFFSLLVAACALPIATLLLTREQAVSPIAWGVLAFLAALQVLLLAVNYGYLVVDKTLPRVAAIGDAALPAGTEGWLVWEGQQGVTFFTRDATRRRALITIPKAKIERMEIVGVDPILRRLFANKPRASVP